LILEKIHPRRILLFIDEFDYLGDPSTFPNPTDLVNLLEKIRSFVKEEKRVFFIFSIGRKLDQLSTFFQMLFKESPSIELKLLNQKETVNLISHPAAGVLEFSADTIQHIYKLTGGHPFITQAVCSAVFDQMRTLTRTQVTIQDVDHSIENALMLSEAGLTWMWSALPIVERFIMAALGEISSHEYPVSQQAISQLLDKFNISLGTMEIMEGSRRLQNTWDILESEQPQKYRFKIEFIRRWVMKKHPVSSALSDIENTNPRARRFLENAREAFLREDYENAIRDFQEAIKLNEFLSQAYLGLAAAYTRLKDYKNAKESAARAYERFPEQAAQDYQKMIIKLVEDYIARNQFDPALNELNELFKIEAGHREGKMLEVEIYVQKIAGFLEKKEWYFASEKSIELLQTTTDIPKDKIQQKIIKTWDQYIGQLNEQKAWAELKDLYDQMEKRKILIDNFEKRRQKNERNLVYWDLNEAAAELLNGSQELADAYNYEIFNTTEIDDFKNRFLQHLREIIPVPKSDQPQTETIFGSDISDRFSIPFRKPEIDPEHAAGSDMKNILLSVGFVIFFVILSYFSTFYLTKYKIILNRVVDPIWISILLSTTLGCLQIFLVARLLTAIEKVIFKRELLTVLISSFILLFLGLWGSWRFGNEDWVYFTLYWIGFIAVAGGIISFLMKKRWVLA
ncbi:hypothetical protein JW964_22225, partial [candidate division KSB1 bacterium]|nr:hypothetical protein [candidate division KSB1 bacterium]